ncbi:hypothetical protein SUGI_1483360 [Cryptomeria japonica]|uniref:TF-B3 domain-containing protein n=1 Tax=Cryptomeria japonica TaxID=3369 RepID=A0AAD3RPL6_CRYJA|nr:hypothetical protein SUGI_1483360 [Cryptomeria japonica]
MQPNSRAAAAQQQSLGTRATISSHKGCLHLNRRLFQFDNHKEQGCQNFIQTLDFSTKIQSTSIGRDTNSVGVEEGKAKAKTVAEGKAKGKTTEAHIENVLTINLKIEASITKYLDINNQEAEQQVPLYDLPSKILCLVQCLLILLWFPIQSRMTAPPIWILRVHPLQDHLRIPFVRLTVSETSPRGFLSVPKRQADRCLAPLDKSQQPQELVAKDLHGNDWRFRHIYRDEKRRHLLTVGWRVFVNSKRLVAGDAFIFLRDENGELRVGVRMPSVSKVTFHPQLYPVAECRLLSLQLRHMPFQGRLILVSTTSQEPTRQNSLFLMTNTWRPRTVWRP